MGADIVAAIASSLVALGGMGAGVWHLSGRLSRIEQVVTRELEPNHGESLRDRVIRIESTLRADEINRQTWREDP